MNRKRILTVIITVIVLASGLILYKLLFADEYLPADDEIALQIQLNTKEDIGLLVFDYTASGHEYSGGLSNANKSLLKHDERLIEVWDKEMLQCSADTAEISVRFRVITEYADPNFENIYPENITKYLDEVSFEAHFGEIYSFTITGDNINGYQVIQN